jgi:hypothetical protein
LVPILFAFNPLLPGFCPMTTILSLDVVLLTQIPQRSGHPPKVKRSHPCE